MLQKKPTFACVVYFHQLCTPFAGQNHLFLCFNIFFGHNWKKGEIVQNRQKNTERGRKRFYQVLLLNPGDTQMLVDFWGKYDFFLYKHPLLSTLPTTLENKSSIRKISKVFYLGTKSQKD